MHACMCVCVCMYVCMYVYVRVYVVYVCMYVRMYVCVYLCMLSVEGYCEITTSLSICSVSFTNKRERDLIGKLRRCSADHSMGAT